MSRGLLLDSDVAIDCLRGHPVAVDYFKSVGRVRMLLSVVTLAEVFAGIRPPERESTTAFLEGFEWVPVDSLIAIQAGEYRKQYGKSHQLELPDALIAATATIRELTLVTLNRKHFPMWTDLIVPYER